MNKRITLIGLFLIVCINMFSQTINGYVKNEKGHPIVDVSVYASTGVDRKNIVSYTMTDVKGYFSLKLDSVTADSIWIYASNLEIQPYSKRIALKNATITIHVKQEAIVLKEVKVKAPKIFSHGDTINYSVGLFTQKNDVSIADVLKRMPGIKVSDAGQISYKGKAIKKFYIEGLDLMKGRYGLATNNLSPDNIATVQVLESHQDIKALEGIQPEDRASINLKLKQGVSGVFNILVKLGGGFDSSLLTDNSLMASYFRRNSQFFATLKQNNSGEDLSNELHSFDDSEHPHTSQLSAVTLPSPPGIAKKHYYFNKSYSTTYNNVYRVGVKGELGINSGYWCDSEDRENREETEHLLPGNVVNRVDETQRGEIRNRMVYGDISYLNNSDKDYLKNQLKFEYEHQKGWAWGNASGTDISQDNFMEHYMLNNNLHWVKRVASEKGYDLSLKMNAEKRPHRLTVSPVLFPELLSSNSMLQQANVSNLDIHGNMGFLAAIVVGSFKITPKFFFDVNRDLLNSELSQYRNNLTLDNICVGTGIDIYARLGGFYLTTSVPFNYHQQSLTGVKNYYKLLVEPNIELSYKLTDASDISIIAGGTTVSPGIDELYSSYILTSYRQLSSYVTQELYNAYNWYSSLRYDYKDIINMLFVGLDVKYSHYRPDVLYGYDYNGVTETIISQKSHESTDRMSLGLRTSKAFNWKKLKLGFEGNYTYSNCPLLVQSSVERYKNRMFRTDFDGSLMPFSWLAADERLTWYRSHTIGMPKISTIRDNLKLDFYLPCNISLTGELAHYYNNMSNRDRNFVLGNVAISWSLWKCKFNLKVDNIFNQKNYIYSSVQELSSYNSTYQIRPRNIMLTIRFKFI